MDRTALATQVIDAGEQAVRTGLVVGSGGNLSIRIPRTDRFLVTGTGTWMDRLIPDDLTLMDTDGAVLDGCPTPSVEWKLHAYTYRERPDVNAVVHLHPQYSVLVDALGYAIRTITLDHAYYLRPIARVPFSPAGSDELAEAAARSAVDHDVVVLAHHGCSTIGADMTMALRRALNLEQAAAATFRCLQLGRPDLNFPVEWLAVLDSV